VTIVWWVLGVVGALLALFLLWLGYQAIRYRRLGVIAVDYLVLQDAGDAVAYIEAHPLLLTDAAEVYIRTLLDQVWEDGDAALFVSGLIHFSLLAGYREYGPEEIDLIIDSFQRQFDALASSSWRWALALLGPLVTEGKAEIPSEQLDEALLEAMEQIMALLTPLAADEETLATQDAIVRSLRQKLAQKAEQVSSVSSQ